MSQKIIDLFRRSKVPLLQSGFLPKAEELTDPKNLPRYELEALFDLGLSFCQAYPAAAVAYTQFPNYLFLAANVNPALRRAIFTSPTYEFAPYPGSLILNPQLTLNANVDYFANPEGCYSIWNSEIKMYFARPTSGLISGYIYNPAAGIRHPVYFQDRAVHHSIGLWQHEYVHLSGLDATSNPARILDFAGHPELETSWGKDWLVYRKKQLFVVDQYGRERGIFNPNREAFFRPEPIPTPAGQILTKTP